MNRVCIISIIFMLATACGRTQAARPRAVLIPPSPPPAEPLASTHLESSRDPRDCPAENPAARVIAEEVERGAALVFTSPENAADLRRRVVDLRVPAVARRAERSADNIRNGIRLVFRMREAEGVSELRDSLDSYAEHIAASCGLTLAPPKETKSPEKRAESAKKPPPKVQPGPKAATSSRNAAAPAKPSPPKPAPKPIAKSKSAEPTSQPPAPPKLPTSLTNTPPRGRPGLPRQRVNPKLRGAPRLVISTR